MDYELGLRTLKTKLPDDARRDFAVFEQRLRDNLRRERLYGGTETTRADRAAIIDELNQLALTQAGVSFNDLCQGVTTTLPPSLPPLTPEERLGTKTAELAQHERNLGILNLQKAPYGLTPPLDLINAIAFEESEIRRLEREIDELSSEIDTDTTGQNHPLAPDASASPEN